MRQSSRSSSRACKGITLLLHAAAMRWRRLVAALACMLVPHSKQLWRCCTAISCLTVWKPIEVVPHFTSSRRIVNVLTARNESAVLTSSTVDPALQRERSYSTA